MLDLFLDVLLDSVMDTLKLIPFLLVTYLAMEAIEHSAGHKLQDAIADTGKAGPTIGALLGALPQCGFSAMAATLFAGRVVTIGTLIAVVLSTSDEMVPVFVAHQEPIGHMLAIMAIKVVVGLVAGTAVDAALLARHRMGDGKTHIHELCERAHCHCDDECGCEHDGDCALAAGENPHEHECCCGHEHGHEHDHAAHECHCDGGHDHGHAHDHAHTGHAHVGHHHGHSRWSIVRSALIHTAQVTGFIFLVTLIFGLIIEGVGQETIGALLANHPVRATFIAGLVGLIPNCGASVAITELYLEGVLASGPMLAGLLSSGGVGLLVLWRTNADTKQNLTITGFVYAVAVCVGLLVNGLGILV